MRKIFIYKVLFFLLSLVCVNNVQAKFLFSQQVNNQQEDTLKFEFQDQGKYEYDKPDVSPLYLENPANIKDTVEYDPATNEYIISKKLGNFDYRASKRMTLEEYQDYQFEQAIRNYWRNRARGQSMDAQTGLFPNLRLGGEAFDKIFGDNAINIVPMGSAELIFKINVNNNENPTISENLRKTTTFDFEEKIMMNVTGNIGDKIKLGVNYNTEATFDFENQTKLEYVGKEDEIIKRIEAGNVTLPLPGSLITGSQSLFGIKTELQFGKLTMTSVFSQQKGETKVIEVRGGAQTQQFEIHGDEYDANRHFFLSQYFRDNYEESLAELPVIKSSVTITKVEVWVTNSVNNNEEYRNVLALLDLGESGNNVFASESVIPFTTGGQYPNNSTNALFNQIYSINPDKVFDEISDDLELQWGSFNFKLGQDYELIGSARKLKSNEYDLNERLGYISLNISLKPDEILAVAYEIDVAGTRYQVGEFSTDGTGTSSDQDKSPYIIAKLLKGTNLSPSVPTWDLMMKNIYSIGAYQVNREDFILNVLYQDDKTGNALTYIPEGNINKTHLISVLNLDNLNTQLDAQPDGRFDFIDGVTINASNGRVIFPVLEPFGSYLKNQFTDTTIAENYIFQELYDTTLTFARLLAEKNKFKLKGQYKSASSSEIMLNAINIPQGSVKVIAGGSVLTENIDYTVDYNLGRVRILNEGLLESGTPLQISLESQALYSIQTKTLLGTHLNYQFSDNFNIGATVMNLTERPLTQKVAIGEEPISNTIWGLNTSYRTESQLVTSMVDRLPFIETKEKSTVLVDAEFAHLIPGHSKAIGEEGNAYIDDFEGSETSMDMKSYNAWVMASTPQSQEDLFPETTPGIENKLVQGFNRARIAWYKIDPLFLRNTSNTPDHLTSEDQSNHFVREIYEREIFPNKQSETSVPTALQVLNVAYYPDERGPYNYVTDDTLSIYGLDANGTLKNPETRWGGIMREVPTTDFEAANVEYIEFWLMDPFVYDSTGNISGDLYFNLGSISEDILQDSRKAFEDGLPSTEVIEKVDTTDWGRVPSNDFSVNTNPNENQDVGLDGLNDIDEESFFSSYLTKVEELVSPEIFDEFISDPSNDNYRYYRDGEYTNIEASILDRYKRFNDLQGNSTGDAGSLYSKSPDSEDINGDKTLDRTESYFQYKVELDPEKMNVGENFIVDKVLGHDVDLANGEQNVRIAWYQFRIPIRQPERIIGSIQDFSSIRFMRMFLKEFEDTVILRFAKLELVRSDWRKYDLSLMEGHEGLSSPETTNGTFEIASVNIEENDNYVLPPGVDRVIDPTNPQLRQLNEQSMVLKVNNLDDGDARAAYKTLNLDIRQYEKLKMFVHAEQLESNILRDDDLRVFIRLGTDNNSNYYEYEIPVEVTPEGNYDDGDREIVWPEENNIEINLDDLVDVKRARNEELRQANTVFTYNSIYSVYREDNHRISVRGNPNLSNVVTIMIGVRNPSRQNNTTSGDDGMPKSGEIWVNELRLTDFRQDGGWAARGRLSTQLADLGSVNFAGSISTPGFGSIDQSVSERNKEETIQYDVSTNLDLGKFFPEKAKVSIPVYAGYSETFINPEYNPLDPDVRLEDALKDADSKAERDSIKNVAQDYTRRKSINFTNVKINKQSQKPRFYDVSNFSVSYSFNETYSRDINTEYDILKNYRGAFNYIYNTRPKNVAPFRKSRGLLSKKAFAIIKDFNFYYAPTSISFRTDVDRRYQANKTRNIYDPNTVFEPTFVKEFNWNRYYDVKWDLSRSLKIDFSATNIAKIDEPYGEVNRHGVDSVYDAWKREVWNNILEGGRNTQYNHNINVTYRVPINKLPLLDWTNLTARYNATYNWEAGPRNADGESILGNTLRNSNTIQFNAQANMVNLYNKVGFLKTINQKYSRGRSNKKVEYEDVSYQQQDIWFREGRFRSIYHDLNTEDITRVSVTDASGAEVRGEWEVSTKRKIRFKTEKDIDGAQILVEGRIEKKENPLIFVAENTARLIMSVKNVSASYTITQGSSLAGYTQNTHMLGMNSGFEAPGWPFVLGWQDDQFASEVIGNNWFLKDSLNLPYLMTQNQNLNFRVTLEPIRGLKIDLTANRLKSENNNRYYYHTSTEPYSEQITGNFSMTYITIGSAFEDISNKNNYYSKAFEEFKENRTAISSRLGDGTHIDEAGYTYGYGSLSQDVMGPAFLAAYGWYYDASNIPLDMFQNIPLPNWSIRYDGLKEIPFLKKIFKSINLSHAYRSSYNIGSFINNDDFSFGPSYTLALDSANNFIPQFDFNSVSINEQFSPLINIDLTWINNLTTRFEIKKSRTVSLSFTNNQITEVFTDELGFSLGYRFDDFNLIFNFGDGQENFKSDLNVRANLKIRENSTILRRIVEDDDIPSADQRATIIGVSADYLLSNRLTLRLFYDQNISDPKVGTNPYRISNTDVGFSLRFTLTQ